MFKENNNKNKSQETNYKILMELIFLIIIAEKVIEAKNIWIINIKLNKTMIIEVISTIIVKGLKLI